MADQDESVAAALLRECSEELNIDVAVDEVSFPMLGINLRTHEPDFIGLIRTQRTLIEVLKGISAGSLWESCNWEILAVHKENLPVLVSALRSKDWSQASDQAAFFVMLEQCLGKGNLKQAFRDLGS